MKFGFLNRVQRFGCLFAVAGVARHFVFKQQDQVVAARTARAASRSLSLIAVR